MMTPSADLLTGRVGLGALILLAGYFFVDAQRVGMYSIIQSQGGTPGWAIVVAVPTVVVSYILGILCIDFAQVTLGHFRLFRNVEDPKDIFLIGQAPELVRSIYVDAARQVELLSGATIAFLLLAFSIVVDRRGVGSERLMLTFVAIAVALAVMSAVSAARAAARARRLLPELRASEPIASSR